MKTLAFILITLVSLPLFARPIGRPVNDEYQKVWNNIDQLWNPQTQRQLRKYHVLIVPGLLATEVVKQHLILKELDDVLTAAQIDHDISSMNSGDNPTNGGPVIRAEIQNSSKPTLLIMDSKAGIDALEGVIDHPEVWPKIRGWLSFQSPYAGTPVNQIVDTDPFLAIAFQILIQRVNGNPDAVDSMGIPQRTAFNQKHAQQLKEIGRHIPMLSFSTWKDPVRGKIDTIFKSFRDRILSMGYVNDGLVPWESEIFPGSDYIALSGLDHITPIRDSFLIPFDRVRFSKTVLYMMLTRTQN